MLFLLLLGPASPHPLRGNYVTSAHAVITICYRCYDDSYDNYTAELWMLLLWQWHGDASDKLYCTLEVSALWTGLTYNNSAHQCSKSTAKKYREPQAGLEIKWRRLKQWCDTMSTHMYNRCTFIDTVSSLWLSLPTFDCRYHRELITRTITMQLGGYVNLDRSDAEDTCTFTSYNS